MILGRTTSQLASQSRTNSERDEAAYEWHMRERLSPQDLAEEAGYDPSPDDLLPARDDEGWSQ